MREAASPINRFGNLQKMWWRTLAVQLIGISSIQDLFPSNGTPPPPGFFKANVDGATANLGGNSSVGVIVRDYTVQAITASCKLLKESYSANLVETMALLHGVMLAQELYLPCVILESDAFVVIQAINGKCTSSSSGHIIQDILHSHNSFESCTFQQPAEISIKLRMSLPITLAR